MLPSIDWLVGFDSELNSGHFFGTGTRFPENDRKESWPWPTFPSNFLINQVNFFIKIQTNHLIILFFSFLHFCSQKRQAIYSDKLPVDTSSLPVEHRGADNPIPLASVPSNANKRQIPLPPNYIPGGPGLLPPPPASGLGYPQGNPIGPGPEDQWPIGAPGDQPQIKNLQVQCEKTHMRVNIEFDRPFYGMIFSKGHYSDPNCVHVRPGSGQLSATFDVYLNSCGMTSSANQV